MVPEEDVVVGRDGAELREALLNTKKGLVHVRHRHIFDELKEGYAQLPVNHHEQDAPAALAGNNEVGLGIPNPHSSIDTPRSFVDECPVGEWPGAGTPPV